MKNANIIIVGLGKTGLSCAKYFMKKGVSVSIADTRDQPPALAELKRLFPSIPIYLGSFSVKHFQKADVLIISPGVSLDEPAIQAASQAGVELLSDIDLFSQEAKAPVIAVTGSNGKSTVVTLMGAVLDDAGKRAIVCGNIGLPVLDALLAPVPDYYVLELSSFQLDLSSKLCPAVAVLLNITPDHLDRHGDFKAYLAAKKKIYAKTALAVFNAEAPETIDGVLFRHSSVSFALSETVTSDWGIKKENNRTYFVHHQNKIGDVDHCALKGAHNWQNMLAVLAMADFLDIPVSSTLMTFSRFSGLAHRCQIVKKHNDVIWINDSKATNVGAAIAAIDGLATQLIGRCILIVGGDSKGVSLDALKQPVSAYVTYVIALGKDAQRIEKTLAGCAEIFVVDVMQSAVEKAMSLAAPNDLVLLSPACASLDQYANYAERGNDFMRAVEAITSCPVEKK